MTPENNPNETPVRAERGMGRIFDELQRLKNASPSPSSCPKCVELEARCKGMEDALGFYGDRETWNGYIDFAKVQAGEPTGTPAMQDAGELARTILAIISATSRKRSDTLSPAKEKAQPTRDDLGEVVRNAWIKWARSQKSPKASWLVPYAELSEEDKEADRQIGETVFNFAQHYIADTSPALPAEVHPIEHVPLPNWWPTFIENVAELVDRNSPDDEPDALVATPKELANCCFRAICSTPPSTPNGSGSSETGGGQ